MTKCDYFTRANVFHVRRLDKVSFIAVAVKLETVSPKASKQAGGSSSSRTLYNLNFNHTIELHRQYRIVLISERRDSVG